MLPILVTLLLLCNQLTMGEEEKIDEGLLANGQTKDLNTEDNEKVPPSTFVPTNHWKEVLPGQSIPRGLHVRMNLATGLKEAKLMEETSTDRTALTETGEVKTSDILDKTSETYLKNLNSEFKERLKKIHSEDGKTPEELTIETNQRKKKFRSMDELKEDLQDLMFNIETDQEIIGRLVKEYASSNDLEKQLVILEDLEYMLHQIDNGIHFIDIGGIDKIVKPGFNSTNSEIQSYVITLVGASSQSNPKVQIAMSEAGIIRSILNIIQKHKMMNIKRKAVFALSCIIRGFPFAQKTFIDTGGLEVLRSTFDHYDGYNSKLQLKVLSLIQDLIDEQVNSEGEKFQQLSEVNIQNNLAKGDWCRAVSRFLKIMITPRQHTDLSNEESVYPDLDSVDKAILGMKSLLPICTNEFKATLPVLLDLNETYMRLAESETDNEDLFYQNLVKDINFIISYLNIKDEL